MEYAIELCEPEVKLHKVSGRILKMIKALTVSVFFISLYAGCLFQARNPEVPVKNKTDINDEYTGETLTNTVEIKPNISDDIKIQNPIQIVPSVIPFINIRKAENVVQPIEAPFYVAENRVIETKNETVIEEKEETEEMVPVIPVYPTVVLHGNGGSPELMEYKLESNEVDISSFEIPVKLGKQFCGWFMDIECTVPFTELKEGVEQVELYAGWKEFNGFLSDEQGMICGYTDIAAITLDGVLAFPTNKGCKGVLPGAFSGLESLVMEVYIPTNVVQLPEAVFDGFYNLIYIEVQKGNPSYYSQNGILYANDGTQLCYPAGRPAERKL